MNDLTGHNAFDRRVVAPDWATPTWSSLISTHARLHSIKPSFVGNNAECVDFAAIPTRFVRWATHRVDLPQSRYGCYGSSGNGGLFRVYAGEIESVQTGAIGSSSGCDQVVRPRTR